MVPEIIKIGAKIEVSIDPESDMKDYKPEQAYFSQVCDIFPNGELEIDMPQYQQKLILLHNGYRYRIMFLAEHGYYMCTCQVVDRYKSGNRYLVRVALKSQLEKVQRREFYRCDCTLDVKYHGLMEEEVTEESLHIYLQQYAEKDMTDAFLDGVILDISGGGLRMVTKCLNEPGSYKRLVFDLTLEGKVRHMNLAGKILSCQPVQEKRDRYENRIKYMYINSNDREDIIKFIFEEERKSRNLKRGN